MWKYTRVIPDNVTESMITNAYFRDLMEEHDRSKEDFTPEAIEYIRHMMQPIIIQINQGTLNLQAIP